MFRQIELRRNNHHPKLLVTISIVAIRFVYDLKTNCTLRLFQNRKQKIKYNTLDVLSD